MESQTKGIFIVIDGIDGAGKTVQVKLTAENLRKSGYTVKELREPTDGPYGQKIRSLTPEIREQLAPEEEMRWFVEDRKSNILENIKPALDRGMIVIQDRYYYSTLAYQGALGLDPEKIKKAHDSFLIEPDIVLFLDIEPEAGLERVVNKRKSSLSVQM